MRKYRPATHLAVTSCMLALAFAAGAANGADWYVSPTGSNANSGAEGSPWRTIGYAVSQASAGDTIWVMDDDDGATDDYTENVVVDKSLTVQAYDSDGTHPQIKAAYDRAAVIHIDSDDVTVRGLDVYGATHEYGIKVNHVEGITNYPLYNVVIEDCRAGWDSSHYNDTGIFLRALNGGRVSGCTASYNSTSGILVQPNLSDTPDLEILGNTTSHNGLHGIHLDYASDGNTIVGNTSESNHLYCLYLYHANDNLIEDNVFASSESGSGIEVYNQSDGNIFKGNRSTGNDQYGVNIITSNNNRLYRNEFEGTLGAVSSTSSTGNVWASPTAEFYRYARTVHSSVLDHYYSDYAGSDADGDGIGDVTHDFPAPETQDDNPLIAPLAAYEFDLVVIFLDGFESGTTDGWSDAVGLGP